MHSCMSELAIAASPSLGKIRTKLSNVRIKLCPNSDTFPNQISKCQEIFNAVVSTDIHVRMYTFLYTQLLQHVNFIHACTRTCMYVYMYMYMDIRLPLASNIEGYNPEDPGLTAGTTSVSSTLLPPPLLPPLPMHSSAIRGPTGTCTVHVRTYMYVCVQYVCTGVAWKYVHVYTVHVHV